jgi:hypothetical protein
MTSYPKTHAQLPMPLQQHTCYYDQVSGYATATSPAFAADDGEGMMGLRAASHVSMENTVDAHEYQPTCRCADCQHVLVGFTTYELLDAYLSQHLAYERSVAATYGFVPCVGGPRGDTVRTVVAVDPDTGAESVAEERSNATVFHFHCHEMRPVPPEVKLRSFTRFHEYRGVAAPQHHGGPRGGGHYGHAAPARVSPQRGGAYGGGAYAPHAGAAARYAFPPAAAAAAYQRRAPVAVAFAAAHPEAVGFPSHATAVVTPRSKAAAVSALPAGYYTAHDSEAAARSAAFSSAARLGF